MNLKLDEMDAHACLLDGDRIEANPEEFVGALLSADKPHQEGNPDPLLRVSPMEIHGRAQGPRSLKLKNAKLRPRNCFPDKSSVPVFDMAEKQHADEHIAARAKPVRCRDGQGLWGLAMYVVMCCAVQGCAPPPPHRNGKTTFSIYINKRSHSSCSSQIGFKHMEHSARDCDTPFPE